MEVWFSFCRRRKLKVSKNKCTSSLSGYQCVLVCVCCIVYCCELMLGSKHYGMREEIPTIKWNRIELNIGSCLIRRCPNWNTYLQLGPYIFGTIYITSALYATRIELKWNNQDGIEEQTLKTLMQGVIQGNYHHFYTPPPPPPPHFQGLKCNWTNKSNHK